MLTWSCWRLHWRKLALTVVVFLPLALTLWTNGLFSPSFLRIENRGSYDLQHLTVGFPRERVEFGDVPAGQISSYRLVFGGVYQYAAYEITVDGERKTQPVIDWIGELPLLPGSYVYVLSWEKTRVYYAWIDLLEIR